MNQPAIRKNYRNLITELSTLIEQGRKASVRAVNTVLVATYWLMGRRIVEFEQKGKSRAGYGEEILEKISQTLIHRFGKGFSLRNLRNIRTFYLEFPIRQTLSAELKPFLINQTVSNKSQSKIVRNRSAELSISQIWQTLSAKFPLSWSHYCLLMRIAESFKREFYEAECIRGNWSVRQLDRQIQSMLYERTALSKRKIAVITKAHEKPIILKPEDEIKDPYILEFLGLKDEYSESDLEDALIKHLERFLLELGIGFTFVAR